LVSKPLASSNSERQIRPSSNSCLSQPLCGSARRLQQRISASWLTSIGVLSEIGCWE